MNPREDTHNIQKLAVHPTYGCPYEVIVGRLATLLGSVFTAFGIGISVRFQASGSTPSARNCAANRSARWRSCSARS